MALLIALLLSFEGGFRCAETGGGAITRFLPDFVTESVEAVCDQMAHIMDSYGTVELGDTGLVLRIQPYDPFSGRSKVDIRISF